MKNHYFYLAYQMEFRGRWLADIRRLTSSDNVGYAVRGYAFSSLRPTKRDAEMVAEEWNKMFMEQGRHLNQE